MMNVFRAWSKLHPCVRVVAIVVLIEGIIIAALFLPPEPDHPPLLIRADGSVVQLGGGER